MDYILRCIEDDIRCKTKESLAVPALPILVEVEKEEKDKKERIRASEIELEKKQAAKEEEKKKRAEADKISATSTFYFNAAIVSFTISVIGFISGSIIFGQFHFKHENLEKSLVFIILASLCLTLIFFLYSYWISWK